MVHISHDTPYMKLFRNFLDKKFRLAIDAWGADDSKIRDVMEPFEKFIIDNVDPKYLPPYPPTLTSYTNNNPSRYRELYPAPVWKFKERISRISRNILLAEFMVREWADHFEGMDEKQLDEIAQSFKFENCVHRDTLNKVLRDHKDVQ